VRTRKPLRLSGFLAIMVAFLVAAAGCGTEPESGRTRVRIALDWTPNTNHTGLFVAQQLHWFEQAGLDVEILPYSNASPDSLVASGVAEFGISFQDTFTFARSGGADITSVMAVVQHWTTAIGVRADRADIRTPADLDGKTYGGFGTPYEQPKMRAVIQRAGGKGDFTTVVLGTSAYEELYADKVDFAEPFLTVEGVESALLGHPLKTFAYADYGFPDSYNVLLIGNSTWLRGNRGTATAFVQAAQRGYQFTATDPAKAAELLKQANPSAFSSDELVTRGVQMLADSYLRDEHGVVGTQRAEKWQGYSGFLFDTGAVTDPDGVALKQHPDVTEWFTNDFIAR
jgi:ABC-type nitrate/sulfonate/bicarbonate transport system substrate-binding protein